jgi:outer membrane protein assembly factor BamB
MRLFTTALLTVSLAFSAGPGDWPNWRGPANDGMARGDAPLRWSDTENIKWKAAIPGRGHSSPVAWGDRIFVTTAVQTAPTPPPPSAPAADDAQGQPGGGRRGRGGPGVGGALVEHKLMLLCLDRKTGKTLWERVAKTAVPHEGYHPQYGSFASHSPVTDGKHVVAWFGSRGVYVYDLDGKLVWEKDLNVAQKIRLNFGEGTAPLLAGDKLILNYDHEGDSFIVALDKSTGKELWKTPRADGTNWSMPVVFTHAGKKQIVVTATKRVRSYDFETGKQIWECAGLGLNTIPAPVAADGIVYVMSGYRDPNLLAIKLGREGDLTGTDAILWTNQKGNSYTPSPVLHDGKLYLLTDNGMFSALDAKTGKPFYQQQRLPKPYNFKASPVGANGKLYLASENGDVIVVKMGETFEVLATNTLEGQTFIGTPAIIDGELYLRGQNTLFCIR